MLEREVLLVFQGVINLGDGLLKTELAESLFFVSLLGGSNGKPARLAFSRGLFRRIVIHEAPLLQDMLRLILGE